MKCENCPVPDGTSCKEWPVFCRWAAEIPQDQVKMKHIINRSTSPDQSPTVIQKLINVAGAVSRVVSNVVQGKEVLVPDKIKKQRLLLCVQCEMYDNGVCKHEDCGCILEIKTGIASESCPVGRWQKVESGKGCGCGK